MTQFLRRFEHGGGSMVAPTPSQDEPDFDPVTYTEPDPTHVTAVPVVLVGDTTEKSEAALRSSFTSITFVGTEAPVRLLANNTARKRAVITVGPGLAGNITGRVWIGKQNQVDKSQGGAYFNNANFEVQSQPEVYCAPDGTNSLTVTVLDEWYGNED